MTKHKRKLEVEFRVSNETVHIRVLHQSHRENMFNPVVGAFEDANVFRHDDFVLASLSHVAGYSTLTGSPTWRGASHSLFLRGSNYESDSCWMTFSNEKDASLYASLAKEAIDAYNKKYKGSRNLVI